jgi:hypothetical protein
MNTPCSIMNQELKTLDDWFMANKLSLNFNKTKYMVFTKTQDNIPSIHIGTNSIEKVTHFHVDGNLNWKTILCTSTITLQVLHMLFIPSKIILSRSQLRMLYFTIFQPLV